MYHAYQHGYSVLPRLRKLGSGRVFQITANERERDLRAKEAAIRHQTCFVEHQMTAEIYKAVCKFVVERYPSRLEEPHTFENLAMQIQEDLIVHRLLADVDWMAAGHVCFPSGWRPEDKIGRPLATIHEPIPGMNFDNQRELVEAMVYSGPFERFVWSVVFEDRLNFHPSVRKLPFNPARPVIYMKVERQLTVGFPEHRAALFVLRQFLIPEAEIDKPALILALRGMTDAQRVYKSIAAHFGELIAYLGAE